MAGIPHAADFHVAVPANAVVQFHHVVDIVVLAGVLCFTECWLTSRWLLGWLDALA